jgi:hypothetical protein
VNLEVPQNFPCKCRCSCAALVTRRGDLCPGCDAAASEKRAPHAVSFIAGLCRRCGLGCAIGYEEACSSCQNQREILSGAAQLRREREASPRPWHTSTLAEELRALWTKFFGDLGAGQASEVRALPTSSLRYYWDVAFDVQYPDGEELTVTVQQKRRPT